MATKKERPSYGEQIQAAWKKAKREENAEAMAYYSTLGDTIASVSFERFKGSAAYESWIEKDETKAAIAEAKSQLSTPWRTVR